jgi:pimeloyl-ACP methyl ester carboxylesterase
VDVSIPGTAARRVGMKKLSTIIAAVTAFAVVSVGTGGPAAQGESETSRGRGHYADVNGLRMYYEVHGRDRGKPPVVLVHGAFSATQTSWGAIIGPLSRTRKVISVEQQGHGRTADIVDRPLSLDQMALDTVTLLDRIGVPTADFYGYSMGAGVVLTIGLNHPEKVNKLVLQSGGSNEGFHPGQLEAMASMTADMLRQSPFYEEYARLNPHPENFDLLVEKVKAYLRAARPFSPAAVSAMRSPVLTIMGDSDVFRPEHAVEVFRLTGGGVNGDIVGLPKSQLAILPGATHVGVAYKTDLLMAMVPQFLDAA